VAPVNNTGARSFAQRESGVTVGTTSRGGQAVFSSSAPTPGKSAAKAASKPATSTPSTRSAAGDLWSGFKPSSRSSVFAAEASAQPSGNGGVTAALALLGLGLAGIAGATSFVLLRSRRAKARATNK
jgi:hypothetical protein